MDDHRKAVYRFLLYHAMLDIRQLRWLRLGVLGIWLPIAGISGWRVHTVRRAGAVADWLHNLAFFSALEFANFEEDRFWRDLAWFDTQYPELRLRRYRDWFDAQMAGTSPGLLAPPPV